MKILIDNIYAHIEYEENQQFIKYFENKINEYINPLDPNRFRNISFRRHIWDGRVPLYDDKNKRLRVGLLYKLQQLIQQVTKESPNLRVSYVDLRESPIKPDIDERIKVDRPEGKSTVYLYEAKDNPRSYQYVSIKNAFEEQRYVVNAATNSGKCVPYNTYVLTPTGYKKIGDLIKEVTGFDGATSKVVYSDVPMINMYGEEEHANAITFNGVRDLLKITLSNGISESMTYNHPLRVVDSEGNFIWKKAKDIDIGDWVVSKSNTQAFGNYHVDTLEARVLGYLIADGSLTQNHVTSVSNDQPEILDEIVTCFKNIDGVTRKYHAYSKQKGYTLNTGRVITEYFHHKYDIPYGKAESKEVPNLIMQADKDTQLAFLSGYLECECSISADRISMEVISKSNKLLRQVNMMLNNLGILSNLKKKVVKNYPQNNYFRLIIRAYDLIKLSKTINFITEQRNNSMTKAVELWNSRNKHTYRDTIPYGDQLLAKYAATYPTNAKRGWGHDLRINHGIGKNRFKKLLSKWNEGDYTLLKQYEKLCNDDLTYNKVIEISEQDSEPTFDVSMPKTHSFIANGGIINHNTNIGIGIAIEGLKELSPNEKIFFVCESKQIFYQSHANFEAALHQPIGLWGDGKCDIQQVTCVMIGTVARALKDPRKTVKLTGAKNTMIKHFAEDYVPKFKDVPNVKQAIKSYIRTHKPKHRYDETIHETLATMVSDPHMSNDKIHKALDWYVTKFDSLIRSKAQKDFDKYQEALDVIKDVKICVVDECHHTVSNSYQDVFALMENTRMWVGLSGTIPSEKEPVKRSKFEGIFGNKIYKISNKYLIDNEISAKPMIKFISVNSPSNDVLNIKAEQMLHAGGAVIPKNQKDLLLYQSVYRLGITENEYRNNLIASLAHKLRLSETGTSLIVVNSLEHGDIIKGILEELGEEVYYLKGEDSTEERNKVLDKVRSGEAKILIGTTILDEGMDLPNLKYLIYASAGKSPRQVLQRVGRVLRISPEKKDTVIFDFMDRTHRLLFNQSKTRLKVYREEQFEIQE